MLFSIWLLFACQEEAKPSNAYNQKISSVSNPHSNSSRSQSSSSKSSSKHKSKIDSVKLNLDDGDILITEIMHDPEKVEDYRGEWIEIYNNADETINLKGLQFKSSSEAGFQIDESILLDPREYFVLAAKSGIGLNGGVRANYIYDYDRFKITEKEKISISFNDKEIDWVKYKTNSTQIRPSHSLSLDPLRFQARTQGSNPNWCPSSSPYGDGDFGTPGKENDPCYLVDELDAGNLIITEIMFHPTKTDQWKGEWIEIFNTTDKVINVQNLSLRSDGDAGVTITEKGYILPQDYFLFGVSKSTTNGGSPVDLAYNYNKLKLFGGDSLSIYAKDILLDSVNWSPKNWKIKEGVALNLSQKAFDAEKNNSPDVWCLAKDPYGSGDLGTPKKANFDCPNIPAELLEEKQDCDENAQEICDGLDNDCDGLIDLSDPSMDPESTMKWYLDVDSDGYGDPNGKTVLSCGKPKDNSGLRYASKAQDCNDNDALINPLQTDFPGDQIDANCDGWDGACTFGNCNWSLVLADGMGLDMALIPAGDDPLGRYNISKDFYMMTTEVTQGQYENLLGKSWKEKKYGFHGLTPDRPVYHVSWYMSANFANLLTRYHNQKEQDNLKECYQCQGEGISVVCQEKMPPSKCSGYRLPTEAEWEYAARSGTTAEIWTGQGEALGGNIVFTSPCSSPATINDGVENPPLSNYAWHCKDNENFPVAQKLPNGFGLYDMHGNEWEWIGDWDSCKYPASTQDPFCNVAGEGKGRKGGDWNDKPFNERVSPRFAKPPGDRYGSIGFRLVRAAKKN